MYILGITDSHDCGVALIHDGKVIAAINEERILREKLCWGFPYKAIDEVLRLGNIQKKDVDLIAVATRSLHTIEKTIPLKEGLLIDENDRKTMASLSKVGGKLFSSSAWTSIQKVLNVSRAMNRQKKIHEMMRKLGFECPIQLFDHHLCHAACAYFTGEKKDTLVITSDDAGDGLSSTVYHGNNGQMEKLHENSTFNSIGTYYGYVTKLCGFSILRHEGKITGLAALGKPIYKEKFDEMIACENGRIVNKLGLRHDAALEHIKKVIGAFTRENLAASIQQNLEEQMVKMAGHWQDQTNLSDMVVAGGVFANVKLNQRLLQRKEGNSVFIHPHMGDGGLAVGAALYAYSLHHPLLPQRLNDVFWGTGYSNEEVHAAIEEYGLKAREVSDVEGEVVELLKRKKVLGWYNGRMEYGPRALGNRSILGDPTDPAINDWLNKRLHRSEFMPFAPSGLKDYAGEVFEGYAPAEYPTEFMTITLDVKKEWQQRLAGVVHVDGTARPQVVTKETNPRYHKILKKYHQETGLPFFINTSFNMHEEPIVRSPSDAIRAFNDRGVDYLVMQNFIIERQEK